MFVAMLLSAAPVFAQPAGISFRPFFLASDQRLSAQTTFNATLGTAAASFWGGGVDVIVRKSYFVDVAVSRMSATGQRAFIDNGQVFRLGVPLRVAMTPLEITGGYRFRLKTSRIVPYAGVGVGSYAYRETADFSTAGEDTSTRHAGFLLTGGAEFRVARWVAVAGDAQYTRVTGILGQSGLSKDANEDNLGGTAGRLRVIIGR